MTNSHYLGGRLAVDSPTTPHLPPTAAHIYMVVGLYTDRCISIGLVPHYKPTLLILAKQDNVSEGKVTDIRNWHNTSFWLLIRTSIMGYICMWLTHFSLLKQLSDEHHKKVTSSRLIVDDLRIHDDACTYQ